MSACPPLLAALGFALAGCAADPPAAPASVSPSFYAALTDEAASVDPRAARDLISIYRHNHGLAPLTIDPALQAAALAKARDMAARDSARGDVALDPPRVAVSNVSAGYHTLAEAFSGWCQSAPHNAHMLDPRMRRIGIATAYAPRSKYKVFWAMVLSE